MRIINKHLSLEILRSYLIILLSLLVVFSLFHFLEELDNEYPMMERFKYILLTIPSSANYLSSLAIFMSAVHVIGQKITNKELQIFLFAAIPLRTIIKKITGLIFLLAIFTSMIGELISPYFYEKSRQVKALASGQTFVETNSDFWIKKNNSFINFSGSHDGKNFQGIEIYEFDEFLNLLKYVSSNSGKLVNKSLEAFNPNYNFFNYEGAMTSQSFSDRPGEIYHVSLDTDEINSISKDLNSISIIELFKNAYLLSSYGLDNDSYVKAIIDRLIKPFITVGLFIIALPWVLNLSRSASVTNMVLVSIAIALILNLTSKFFSILTFNFGVNVYISSFTPLLIIAFINIIIFPKIVNKY